MATIVLFHSALGLRPSVRRLAKDLQQEGHQVVTPDLFGGQVFDHLKDGVALRDEVGIETLAGRAQAAVAKIDGPIVVAGFSMGAASAQMVALTRPDVRGLVMMHAALPLEVFGQQQWPAGLPVQIHTTAADQWVDQSVVDSLQQASPDQVEVFRYEGAAHLFADENSDEFDGPQAELMLKRLRAFLTALESTPGADDAKRLAS